MFSKNLKKTKKQTNVKSPDFSDCLTFWGKNNNLSVLLILFNAGKKSLKLYHAVLTIL